MSSARDICLKRAQDYRDTNPQWSQTYELAVRALDEASEDFPRFVDHVGGGIERRQSHKVDALITQCKSIIQSSNQLSETQRKKLGSAFGKALDKILEAEYFVNGTLLNLTAAENERTHRFKHTYTERAQELQCCVDSIGINLDFTDRHPEKPSDETKAIRRLADVLKSTFGPCQVIPHGWARCVELLDKPKSMTGYDPDTLEKLPLTCSQDGTKTLFFAFPRTAGVEKV